MLFFSIIASTGCEIIYSPLWNIDEFWQSCILIIWKDVLNFFLIPTHLSSYIKYIYPQTCHQIRCSKIEIFLRWIFVYTLTQAFFQSTALLVISSYLQRRQKIMRKTSVSNSLFLGYLRSTFSLFVGLFEWTPSWGRKVVIPLKGFSLLGLPTQPF